MPNPLFQQLMPQANGGNNLIQQFLDFQKTFTGNPQQIIQTMLNSGRISQAQLSQLTQQANQIYSQIYGKKM